MRNGLTLPRRAHAGLRLAVVTTIILAAWTASLIVAQLRMRCAAITAGVPQQHARTQHPAANGLEPIQIVTAANDLYYNSLVNFVGSVRYWCPECHVHVYNIGMSQERLSTIK